MQLLSDSTKAEMLQQRKQIPGFEELAMIMAHLQPRFYQYLWDSAQTVSFLQAKSRLKKQQKLKDLNLFKSAKKRRTLRDHQV